MATPEQKAIESPTTTASFMDLERSIHELFLKRVNINYCLILGNTAMLKKKETEYNDRLVEIRTRFGVER